MLPPYALHASIAALLVAVVLLVSLLLWGYLSEKRGRKDEDQSSDVSGARTMAPTLTPSSEEGSVPGLRKRSAAAAASKVHQTSTSSVSEGTGRVAAASSPSQAGASTAPLKSAAVAKVSQLGAPKAQAESERAAAPDPPRAPKPPNALQRCIAEWKNLWLLRQCAVSRLIDRLPGPLERERADDLKRAIWKLLDDRPKLVATGCDDGQARIFELATGRMLVSVRHDVSSRQPIGSIVLAPGPVLLTGTWDGRWHNWDEWPQKPARPDEFNRGEKYIGHENQIVDLALSRDHCKIVSACSAGKVLVFRKNCRITEVVVSDPEEIVKLKETLKIGDHSELYLLQDITLGGTKLLRDDELLKEADFEGKQMRRDLDKLELPARLHFRFAGCLSSGHHRSWRQLEHDDSVFCMVLSAEGADEFVYSGSRDRSVRKWKLDDASHVHTYLGHSSMVRCLAVNQLYLVSGGDDGKAMVWRKDRPELIRSISAHSDFVQAMSLCPTFPKRLVTAGYEGRVLLWDLSTGKELLEYEHQGSSSSSRQITAVRIHESTMLTCSTDKFLRVWNTESGEMQAKMRHVDAVRSVSLL